MFISVDALASESSIGVLYVKREAQTESSKGREGGDEKKAPRK